MKSAVTILFLLLATISFAQSQNFNNLVPLQVSRVMDFKNSVTVDSAEDIESTFKIKNVKRVLNEVSENDNITFENICNRIQMSYGEISNVSYKLQVNSSDLKGF